MREVGDGILLLRSSLLSAKIYLVDDVLVETGTRRVLGVMPCTRSRSEAISPVSLHEEPPSLNFSTVITGPNASIRRTFVDRILKLGLPGPSEILALRRTTAHVLGADHERSAIMPVSTALGM